MRIRTLGFLLLAAVAAACSRPSGGVAQAPSRPRYLADVPLIPGSFVTDTTGSPEVEHRSLLLQWPMDSVVGFYRRELAARGWRTVGDVSDTSRVSLYLQREGRTLWVQIHSIGLLATEYALTAAATATVPPPR